MILLIAPMTYAWAIVCLVAVLVAVLNTLQSLGNVLAPDHVHGRLAEMLRASDLQKDIFLLLLVLSDLAQSILDIALLGPLSAHGLDIRITLRSVEIVSTVAPLAYMIMARLSRRAMLAQAEHEV